MSAEGVERGGDPGRCPLCGEPNACALAARGGEGSVQPPCWCVGERFPDELLASARATDGATSCICRGCLSRAEESSGRAGADEG